MSGREGTPVRRFALLRGGSDTRPTPRSAALDALLRDMDDLRLTLETDLTLAAAAVENGALELAGDILSSDESALHAFEARSLARLRELESASQAPRRSWTAHAAPFAVAAALVGVLAGVIPRVVNPTPEPSPTTAAASDSLERIQAMAVSGDTQQLREASVALHAQLQSVLATAHTDPASAQTALLLLSYEQNAIVRSGDVSALADVLRQSKALSRAIRANLPVLKPTVGPTPPPLPVEPTASPTPSPKPSPSASPKASASASPSPSPSPSPTKSDTAIPQGLEP